MIIGPLQLLGWFFGILDESPRVQQCSELGQVAIFILTMILFIFLFPVWMVVCFFKAIFLYFYRFKKYKQFKRRTLSYHRKFKEAKL